MYLMESKKDRDCSVAGRGHPLDKDGEDNVGGMVGVGGGIGAAVLDRREAQGSRLGSDGRK